MADNLCFDDFLSGVPCMASELELQLQELEAQATRQVLKTLIVEHSAAQMRWPMDPVCAQAGDRVVE